MRLDIKPLSVNKVWQGKRFKTKTYKQYERELLAILRPFTVPEGDLMLTLEFGFSNAASDWDNPIKPFQDILQKKYGFNDSRVVEAHVKKVKVKKGCEYIEWGLYAAKNQ